MIGYISDSPVCDPWSPSSYMYIISNASWNNFLKQNVVFEALV